MGNLFNKTATTSKSIQISSEDEDNEIKTETNNDLHQGYLKAVENNYLQEYVDKCSVELMEALEYITMAAKRRQINKLLIAIMLQIPELIDKYKIFLVDEKRLDKIAQLEMLISSIKKKVTKESNKKIQNLHNNPCFKEEFIQACNQEDEINENRQNLL